MNLPDENQPPELVAATRLALAYCEHLQTHGLTASGIVMAALAEACDAHELGESMYAAALIGVCQYMATEYRALALEQHLQQERLRAAPEVWGIRTQGPPEEKSA